MDQFQIVNVTMPRNFMEGCVGWFKIFHRRANTIFCFKGINFVHYIYILLTDVQSQQKIILYILNYSLHASTPVAIITFYFFCFKNSIMVRSIPPRDDIWGFEPGTLQKETKKLTKWTISKLNYHITIFNQ